MESRSKDALQIAQDNYTGYSKYVVATRAYPGLKDGAKKVARRSIHTCYRKLPRTLVKSVNAIGEIVKVHPHPNSIYGVLVGMASKYDCRFPLYETKGNFGGLGHPCAAERYTELMISDLACKIFESFSDYIDMSPGEMGYEEPISLATYLPLCFLHGTYGIPTGMSTVNIPALNPIDMVKYYIKVLESRNLDSVPNMMVRPNVGDVKIKSTKEDWLKILEKGQGSVYYYPSISIMNDNRSIVITGLPPSKKFAHVNKILEQEILRDQIDLRDETTNSIRFVIEIPPYRRVNTKEIYQKLLKGLTASESYKFIFADDDGNAIHSGFHGVVKENLQYLIRCAERKFREELANLEYKLKILQVIEEMKKDGCLSKIVEMNQVQAIKYISDFYKVTEDQAKSVLSKSISYLTREHQNEISDIIKATELNKSNNDDVYSYLVKEYKSLLKDITKFIGTSQLTEFSNEVIK